MKNLSQYQDQLRQLLPEKGGIFVLDSLLEVLPTSSPQYNAVISLKKRYKDLKIDKISGVLSVDDQLRLEAILDRQLLELIGLLEASDFDRNARRSRLSGKQKIRRGHVLYRVPKEMQLHEEYRCRVRIAFDEETVLEDLQLDKDTALKSGVRISQYMKVEIKDPSATPVFAIRSTSEPVQFIDEDDYTEWRFYVQPLQAGEHVLELTVTIIQRINGEDRVRERTLEESVVIITEPLAEAATEELPWQRDAETLVMPYALHSVSPQRVGLAGGWLRTAALGLAFLLAVSSTAYAFGPKDFRERVDWAKTRYLQDSAAAYEEFLATYPETERKETATFKKAKAIIRDTPENKVAAIEAMAVYLEAFGGSGQYVDEAYWEMALLTEEPDYYQDYLELPGSRAKDPQASAAIQQLEPRLWARVSIQPSAVQLDRYLRIYPQGQYRRQAIRQLADSAAWQQPANLPPATLRDTSGWQQRLRTYAAELAPQDSTTAQQLHARSTSSTLPPVRSLSARTMTTEPPPTTIGEQEKEIPTEPAPPEAPSGQPEEAQEGSTSSAVTTSESTPSPEREDRASGVDHGVSSGSTATPASPQPESERDDITDSVQTSASAPAPGSTSSAAPLKALADGFVRIAGGTFTMGCLSEERDGDCDDNESPHREVSVPTFYLSKYEVTQAQWEAVMGDNPSDNSGCEQCPVETVSWDDIQEFLRKLNAQTGKKYRLPTEAEWEYAARGGQKGQTDNYRFSGSNTLAAVAWYFDNSGRSTHPVGQKQPNQLGLHDMSGNIFEWVQDCWHDSYSNAPADAQAWLKAAGGGCDRRVVRGGCWFDLGDNCRVSYRLSRYDNTRLNYFGFRLARY